MVNLPSNLKQISLFLERLPGIGEKTANRLAFYLLRLPEVDLKDFAKAIADLKSKTKLCRRCYNFTETEVCNICTDDRRDQSIIAVVESVLDLLAFEQGGIYNGVYHVLHGRIDPLNNIGPDDIYLTQLIERIRELTNPPNFTKVSAGKRINGLKEIILATNPDMEGEATAMYIKNQLKILNFRLKITRLGYGLPIGANLEYADYMTLKKSIENRNGY